MSSSQEAIFYVDGFNLYYRAVKGTPYKWLDLLRVCQRLAPSFTIKRIRYFTALIQAQSSDPQSPLRQQVYIRALKTISCLSVEYGQFRRRRKRGLLLTPIHGVSKSQFVDIQIFEEKGTDVNLATHLVADSYEERRDRAFVISNDADLVLPIRFIRDELRIPVTLVNPNRDRTSKTPRELSSAASDVRLLSEKTLRECQFPATMVDADGTITKPAAW